jgi:hypothetical protein
MSFQVFAYYTSAISGAENPYELVPVHRGHAFKNLQTGNIEQGTYTEAANRFEALDLFRRVFIEMHPRFELK